MAPSPSPPPSPGDDVPVSALSRGRLIDVLTDTVGDLERLELPLTVEGIDGARRLRSSLIGQVRDHVLPRLADADVPAIVVVGGSTGAGKSTLVNSVLGREVSDAGVLRPTTRTPVLVVNPEDTEVLADHPVSEVSLSVVSDVVPAGLALVDASDLDSVHEANRTLAVRLLEATDLWLFVTTAARYGDQTPWSTLEEAARRNTPIAVVLNRVPARILSVVRRDLVTRLEGLGLAESPFFVVPDAGPHEGLLPASSVAELRDWLSLLAGRHRAAGLMRRTDRSLWPGLRSDLNRLADAVDAQDDAGRRLERTGQALLAKPLAALRDDVARGVAGDGAPATRWVSHASAGGALASLAQGGRLRRGLLGRAAAARGRALGEVVVELREALVLRLSAALSSVVAQARMVWEEAGVADRVDGVLGAGPGAEAVVDEWIGRVRADPPSAPGGSKGIRGLEPRGAADLVIAASCGVEGAADSARRLGLTERVTAARSALIAALTGALHAAVPAGAALRLVPYPALVAALRLRAGELVPFVHPGTEA